MPKLLIATGNQGKLKEYKILLKELPIKLVSLKDEGIEVEAPEDGQTYEENAIKKALFYHKLSGLPALADDGGLEIDYLEGAPGIKSRYWLGYKATDEELIQMVLKKLAGLPTEKRGAKLKIVLAFVLSPKEIFTSAAELSGFVVEKPYKLIPGYPYRSILYLPHIQKVYSELSFEEEVKIGHRKQALKRLYPLLKKLASS